MPEGEVYNFEAGELKSIGGNEEGDEDVEALKQDLADAQAENSTLKTELDSVKAENKKNAKLLKKLNKRFEKLEELSGGIDLGDEGDKGKNGNRGHKKTNNGGKTRALWKDGEYKRAN